MARRELTLALCPKIIPDNVARAFVMKLSPFHQPLARICSVLVNMSGSWRLNGKTEILKSS